MGSMEDSGIDSDSRSNCNGVLLKEGPPGSKALPGDRDRHHMGSPKEVEHTNSGEKSNIFADRPAEKTFHGISMHNDSQGHPSAHLISTSQLQKRLEQQILRAKKVRQKELNNSSDSLPKKPLIPRNKLKVPGKGQVPVVTKADTHPLVSWESESDEEFEFHPMSKSAAREITQQLIKDGYNLDLTPDDDDLDLIPPKPIKHSSIEAKCNKVLSLSAIS